MSSVETFDNEHNDNEQQMDHEVLSWLESMTARGEIASNPARLRASALRAMMSILQPEEPRDTKWLLENIESINRRWAIKTQAKPDTAGAYLSRSKGVLADFLKWQEDPLKFKFAMREVTPTPKKVAPKKPSSAPSNEITPPPPPVAPKANRRTVPLGDGREFVFDDPPPGFKRTDVMRIAMNLLTLTEDFDPFDVETRQAVYGLLKSE